jgi:hypothetical protein
VCYTFQEETARVAFRQVGTIRDFDDRVDDLLAEGPHALGANFQGDGA